MHELTRKDQILLITEMIADIWGRYPELRLGQLIWISLNGKPAVESDLFNLADIDLLTALEDYDIVQQERHTDGPKNSNG